ncbi:virulence-associated E family protein [Pseudomonas gregormendelii]|uniref:Virulence-associated E family protein n=1 Tax=Pseudomonas gregormendelii TaxID=1628277 RepID=A0ABS3AFG8_9PSED|nr:VapE domain-containing protein [Pseudomonas gregormendelii]MBN3965707.1 virulence-associated E family protein [Pseudomonas gregormendelii]
MLPDIKKTHASAASQPPEIPLLTPPPDHQNCVDTSCQSAANLESAQVDLTPIAKPLASLADAESMDPDSFPNQPPQGKSSIPATIQNTRHILQYYGVVARYNVIKKKTHITLPGSRGTTDNADSVAMTHIINLATLNGLPIGQVPGYVEVIADSAAFNPVADWINSETWDGQDRLTSVYDTLTVRDGFPLDLRNLLIYRWLLSAVAAGLMSQGFRARGVLTLQGPQSIGKTTWVLSLVPDPLLRDMLVKGDHHLDGNNKDSILTAVSHWIVEIGELDSSFKKDIARLKGFLTNVQDKLRRPYARVDAEYARRTVFCATVNESNFLVDGTGNSRWWTVPVISINTQHGINMQQVFAQLALDFKKEGARWWLDEHEEALLELHNKDHRNVSAIREALMDILDLGLKGQPGQEAMTASQVLRLAGYEKPSTPQCKECGSILRELIGEPKRINGDTKWRIPRKASTSLVASAKSHIDENGDY